MQNLPGRYVGRVIAIILSCLVAQNVLTFFVAPAILTLGLFVEE
ncbi:hypothetical protein NT01EI_0500 [Edwardsiella ictaluri 93-146]|uniref:Uncharacterized protein n=1 Tax=Edwardsiella ictaluri (strain 93-146) TaxID=634503 RepID=C5BH52_EDWI9|nr:hypothetical protein NT01EI_0500 [Edwardsiella ictaluri 93-146]STP87278.1 Uncharacterised protein [Edwardsiella ictaluri]